MELSKNFEPQTLEEKWYKHWMAKGYFKSVPDEREPYTIVMPPPNVTGVLHMGHCLNNTIQDILIRRARMQGKNACWVPGTDHASIATEAKVVAMLRERGITKSSLTRDEFLAYAWEWKEKYGGIILQQLKKLGFSLDWDRTSFTMDADYYASVIKVFIELHKKGIIYRGKRMINWDVKALTALSDEEVIRKETKQKLYYIRYRIETTDNRQQTTDAKPTDDEDSANSNPEATRNPQPATRNSDATRNPQPATRNFITIATVRPETIMGDTAIAVHPDDERYKHLHGKFAIVPLINRRIPIITDEYVTTDFGTGALKVTPAHDVNDNMLGQKHGLEVIDIFNDNGTLNEAAQIHVGLDRFAARKKIAAELEEKGFVVKTEEYTSEVGYSERTDEVVEPRLSLQWWVKMKDLATPALRTVMEEEIKFYPPKFKNLYRHWMENIKDWCISRQLWWGHRIPAWYDKNGNYVVAETRELAIKEFNIQHPTFNISDISQDEDCLDTWFSSWLWPFEVFKGYSNPGNKEVKYYYPTDTLVTAPEIIFFWVARMVMAGFEFEQQKPFQSVYFTGIVRDKQGRKMSKSLGNSPDLLGLIDQYGADATRFGIMIASPAGNDILFDESALEQGRNFNNKMWNAVKLVKLWEERQERKDNRQQTADVRQQTTDNRQETTDKNREQDFNENIGTPEPETTRNPQPATRNNPTNSTHELTERESNNEQQETSNFAISWFENRLREVRSQVNELLDQFKLSEALKVIYSLIWDDFCSWYLEWVKPGFEQPIEAEVYKKTVEYFTALMELLHPFMPFITEEIYHLLAERKDDLMMKASLTETQADTEILRKGLLLKSVITGLRDVRNKNQLKPKDAIRLHIESADPETYKALESILAKQINSAEINHVEEAVAGTITTVIGKDKFYIETEQPLNTTGQKESLEKELLHLQGFLVMTEKKLGNEKFVANAKAEVLALEQKKKADAEMKIRIIEESLAGLK